MDKYHFLLVLSEKLKMLPEADRQRSIEYYAEMIADRMEEGLSEEEAVADIGSVDAIAKDILAEVPVAPTPIKQSRHLRWWEITLIVLGSPLWLSLLISVAAVVFSVLASLWSVVISLYATALALGVSALGCIFASFFMIFYGNGELMIAWGVAFICASLAILIFLLSNLTAKGMVALTKCIFRGIRRAFRRKEHAL